MYKEILCSVKRRRKFELKRNLLFTRGRVSFASISDEYLRGISNTDCDVKCNFMWDGYGRWVQNKWKPYFKGAYNKGFFM